MFFFFAKIITFKKIYDAIPVHEEEEKHAYELPMRGHEGKTKLEKSWKQGPPMKLY